MKFHSHIRSLYLPWVENRLSDADRNLVTKHLEECASCNDYYGKLSAALLPSNEDSRVPLMADPFLSTRIRALVDSKTERPQGAKAVVGRWTLTTAIFAAAICCGVYIGEKLSYRTTAVVDQNVIPGYLESLETGGIADRLQSIAQSNVEVSK